MVTDTPLMSDKEKDYIAGCYEKRMKSLKLDLDYESLFSGNKIVFDLDPIKKETKEIFAKQDKRSRKWIRESLNSENFLKEEMSVIEMMEVANILRYIELGRESFQEIQGSLFSSLEANIQVFNTPLFYSLLDIILNITNKDLLLKIIFDHSNIIKDKDALSQYLIKRVDIQLYCKYIWNNPLGNYMGYHLLKKDPSSLSVISKMHEKNNSYEDVLPEFSKMFISKINEK